MFLLNLSLVQIFLFFVSSSIVITNYYTEKIRKIKLESSIKFNHNINTSLFHVVLRQCKRSLLLGMSVYSKMKIKLVVVLLFYYSFPLVDKLVVIID